MLLPAVCQHDRLSQLQPTWWHYTAKQLQMLEEVNLMSRQFDVLVERDSEGFFVATVPALPGCHTQAKSLDQLMERIKEAIELCLEVEGTDPEALDFVGVQRVTVEA